MSPNRTPQTPNIFDILIDSITTPLKHEKPQTRPTPHQNRSTIAPNPAKTHQANKASNNTNDNFNFFDWLFCQNQPKAQTKFSAPTQKTPPIPKPTPQEILSNYHGIVEQDVSRHDFFHNQSRDKIEKLGNSQIIQNHDQKVLKEAQPIQMMQKRSFNSFSTEILPPQSIIKPNLIHIEESYEAQKFLDFFYYKHFINSKNLLDFDEFKTIFHFSLSLKNDSDIANYANIKIDKQQISKFLELTSSFLGSYPDELKEIAVKSINALNHYKSYIDWQESIHKITTESSIQDKILLGAFKKVAYKSRHYFDKLHIFEKLLDPNTDYYFFLRELPKSYTDDRYKPGKSMILERSENDLNYHVYNLQRIIYDCYQAESIDPAKQKELDHIYFHLKKQHDKIIDSLHTKFNYIDPSTLQHSRTIYPPRSSPYSPTLHQKKVSTEILY